MNTHQVQTEGYVREALRLAGHPDLEVRITWSNRMARTLGKAIYRPGVPLGKPKREIRFSQRAWDLITEEDRKETAFHEVAHVVDRFENPTGEPLGHGVSWRQVMRRLGLEPQRLASEETSLRVRSIQRSLTRHIAACGCLMGCKVTAGVHKRIGQGRHFECRTCHKRLKPTSQIVKVV